MLGASHPRGKLVLIIGPSGAGKSVILQRLREKHPEFVFPRSATTRPRRPGEGEDLYRFMDDAAFDALLRGGGVIEWAQVHGGARYGTLKDEIVPAIEAGKTVVREVDVQGFDSIRANALFAGKGAAYRLQSVFIVPESKELLIERITKRAPMGEEELRRRIKSMEKELDYARLCDARVTNAEGKLEAAVAAVEAAVAERH